MNEIMIWAIVLATLLPGILMGPVETLRSNNSIGNMYKEKMDLLPTCKRVLNSICEKSSLIGCNDTVAQIEKRLASIPSNSCDETTVRPPEIEKEIRHTLDQLNIKKVLNDIKKLGANLLATESMNNTFVPLSRDINEAIDTLEQVSSKCSEIVPNQSNILKQIFIGLVVVLAIAMALVFLIECMGVQCDVNNNAGANAHNNIPLRALNGPDETAPIG
ncbi:uncharacterized protein LOC129568815 isoform X1 [Sitodiplosis mosellana]|uniref:uncharacterized protein LOC129568815 isoform X1 n=1 Tax=Sitodiplosis mosellana TaxID=263140 RepID=UPI002444A22F|nr:uncharacterized protein LOC129568815 isoform X1 [Sitodiplosis mosellana]